MTDHSMMKLGRKPARLDARVPELRSVVAFEVAPLVVDWYSRVPSWPMLANDQVGDCTCAAVGHIIQQWTTYTDKSPVVMSDQETLTLYSQVSNYPAVDEGALCITVLERWRVAGVGTPDGGPDTLDAYAAVQPTDRASVLNAITRFGNLYAGVALPTSAQNEEVWASTSGEPGSWGGHCIPLVGITPIGPMCVTWGALKQMTWGWWERYAEESYVPLSRDWVGATDLNWSQLTAALEKIAA